MSFFKKIRKKLELRKAQELRPVRIGEKTFILEKKQGKFELRDPRSWRKVSTINYYVKGKEGFIDWIKVQRKIRGKGIGTMLTREAVEDLRKKGVESIELQLMPWLRKPAVAVLKKTGFKQAFVTPNIEIWRFEFKKKK